MDRSQFKEVIIGVAGMVIFPLAALLLLSSVGQPALRWSYQWNGNHAAPIYHHCEYVALTTNYVRRQHCPLIDFFPVTLWRF